MKKTRNKRKTKSYIFNIIATIVIAVAIFLNQKADVYINAYNQKSSEDNVYIYFIDVGQADSILIQDKEDFVLIDAGDNEHKDVLVNYLKEKNVTTLKYVIGTHPHEDHIGGLSYVIDNFDIQNLIMPKIQTNTKSFENVLDSATKKGLKITEPKKRR